MAAFYRDQETELDQTMQTRHDWERATEHTRRRAIAANSELRRRHPTLKLDPLRSAEPLVAEDERAQLHLEPGTPEYTTPEWITQLAAERHVVQKMLAKRQLDHGLDSIGELWSARWNSSRDAVLQPPKPEMPAAKAVLERAAEREAEP